jgi:hypothetical protein
MEAQIALESETRLVKIPILINSQGPFSFDLDTGASTTTLSKRLVNGLGITTRQEDRVQARGLGGGIPTEYAMAKIGIGPLTFDEDEVYVLDLDALLKGAGVRDGVLGHPTLKYCRIVLNYSKRSLRIARDDQYPQALDHGIDWSTFG